MIPLEDTCRRPYGQRNPGRFDFRDARSFGYSPFRHAGQSRVASANASPVGVRRRLIERGFARQGAPLDGPRTDALVRDFLVHYEAHIADESRLFPGALAALDRFRAAGFRLAVCTNKPEPLARLLLQKLSAADRFAAICGRGSFPMHKPDPHTLWLTIEAADGDPRRAVMVGDSKTDIDTARAAGTPSVAVDFGYTDTPVAAFSPDRVISHFDELWDAVASLDAALFAAAPYST